MLKIHDKRGTIVDKGQEMVSFRQSDWLEKYIKLLKLKNGIEL